MTTGWIFDTSLCENSISQSIKTKNKTYRLWDPADPLKITNSAEVSFREKDTRDVPTPKAGYDPFPEPTRTICQPGYRDR